MVHRGSNTRIGCAHALFAGLLATSLWSIPASAQSPPAWPTPVVTPTATPAPEPQAPKTEPTPIPAPAPEAPEAEPTPAPEPDASEQPAPPVSENQPAETSDDTPKSERETNPGDVAFTDYQSFDLDEIEHEPAKTKWGNFVNAVRGLSRYSLFDGRLKFRIGGKAQFDGSAGKGNDKYGEFYLPIENDFSVRRFEIFAVGRINKFNFNLGFELGPDWGLSDAWIEGSEGGLEVWGKYLGKLRVGFMNEPFSLERQNSAYSLGLMERSLPVQTFSPGTNLGAMVHDSSKNGRSSWAVGLFSFGHQNDANASGSVLSLTGRFTHLLAFRNDGKHLIHVGASFSSRSPSGNDTRYRSRPEARFVDYLVDTGTMDVSQLRLLGAEFAAVRGPLWVQAEYLRTDVSAQLIGDPVFMGSYVKVGWFLTGENRPYRKNSGLFDRVLPRTKYTGGSPFKKRNGGAWEIVGRLSRVDLTGGLVEGGELFDISAGLSWYVNATTRLEINYIHASPKNQGAANIFLLRLQYRPW